MGRGTSPLRSVVRGSPKKPLQENMDANCGDLTPSRKPLGSISEASRNADENGGDVRSGKKRSLFPHMENVEGTPERHGNGKSKRAHNRYQSPVKGQPAAVEVGVDEDVVPRGHEGATKQGSENVNSHTPRAQRNERGSKHGTDSEPVSSVRPNCNQSISATPAKSVTRTLKYGVSQGSAPAGPSTSRALVPLPGGGRNAVQGTSELQFNLEEDPTFWLDHNVQVLIRTRPISSTEMVSQGFSKCLRQESAHTLTWLGPPETRFTFDHVAGEIISQEKLFNVAGLPMVENCMAGYNSCMFAYGQTGSGKTHTMLGDIEHLGDRPSDNRGMTPRVFEHLFSRIQLEEERRKDENLKFLTKCSFLEIYNEQITDLLEPSSTNLQMREDVRKGVYVENLTEVEVNSVKDVIQLLSQGSANRKVAATNMNRESSRSHSVFTCIIESRWERDSMSNIRFGRLNLVDLAGSERQKTSGAEGERLKEAANINKSLSTLGLVIMILVDVANGKQRHVPYRDSKLTFLLQDSLGGNSKTTIIATVSPSSCNALETLSTLKFAQRAKLIRNTAVINEDASGDVKALRAQIQQMKEELDRLRRQSISRIPLSQDDFNPGRGSFDSWGDAHKFFSSPQVSSRKVRQMEAVVAGALRREQAADMTTKRLASEIEQLNRLVHQREADTQSSKMVLRFREDKIRRLETLSKGLLSVDSYLADEKKMLMEELELMREKVDRNPELTRFAMENIRLLDQIRSLQEFHEGGERDAMLEEIANLRDQLLEVLDGKIAVDQGLVPLTTPQKKALAPELAAAARESELLRLEADNYRSEVEELRSNLSSSLESYSKMGRQVDELQEVVEKLKTELAAKEVSAESLGMKALEAENLRHLDLIAEMKEQLEQSAEKSRQHETAREQLDQQLQDSMLKAENLRSELESTKEAFEAARDLVKKLQSKEASLVGAQYAEAVKQMRLETEEMAAQQSHSLTSIEEIAVQFRLKEMELRAELDEAQQMIQKLSANRDQRKSSQSNSLRTEDSSIERLQKAQEVEMRHAEEVMQLQLELESLEAVLEEERAQKQDLEEKLGQFETGGMPQTCSTDDVDNIVVSSALEEEKFVRQEAEEKVSRLTQQLEEAEEMILQLRAESEVRETTYFDAVSRLQLYSPDQKSKRPSEVVDNDKAVMEALENQHLYSIQEFDALQGEHTRLLEKLKRREERERMLRRKIERLEHELMKEQEIRELEQEYADLEDGGEVDEEERQLLEQKLENAKRELEIAHSENLKLKEEESEKDLTRCEAESETVLAITSLQAELVELKAEAEVADRDLAAAKVAVSKLTSELESMRLMLSDVKDENLQVIEKYESTLRVKDCEIETLRKDWQSATVKLIDYLAEGDQALNEASREMEQIFSGYLPSSARSSRDTMTLARTNDKKKAVDLLKQQLQHAQELAKDAEGRVRVLSEAAFAMATAEAPEASLEVLQSRTQATEEIEVLEVEVESARQKLVEFERNATVLSVVMMWLSKSLEGKEIAGSMARAKLTETEELLSQLRVAQEAEQALLIEFEERARLLSDDLEESKRTSCQKEGALAELGCELLRLQAAVAALESDRKQLVESKEKVECETIETSSAMNVMKEELGMTRCLLKEAEEKACEAAAAHESLAIVKEEWEAEKAGLESDVVRLEKERARMEAEMEVITLEVANVQACADKLSDLVLKKEAEVAALKEETKNLSCMSVAKEEQVVAHEAQLEQLRSELRQKEILLERAEIDHRESAEALVAVDNERKREISELIEQSERLSCMRVQKEEELCESRREIEVLRSELESMRMLMPEAEAKLAQAVQDSEQLMKEKYEQLAVLKEENERMSCTSLKKEEELRESRRSSEVLRSELETMQVLLEEVEAKLVQVVQDSEQLKKEKDEQLAVLKEESERMSCTSLKKEEELRESRRSSEVLRSELETMQVLLEEVEAKLVQAVQDSEQLKKEKDEQLAVLKEESERMSCTSLKKEEELRESRRSSEVLRSELETMQVLLEEVEAKLVQAVQDSEQLKKEKDEQLAVLKEESERMSCMSVKKEDGEVMEMRRKLEALQDEIRAKERSLEEVERQLLESVQASKAVGKEKDEAICELQAEVQRLSSVYAENSGELCRLREELQAVQAELETREVLLQESQTRVIQADAALERLAGENEAIQSELESRSSLLDDIRVRAEEDHAALEALTVEKAALEERLERSTVDANVAASRLCESEEAHFILQEKVAVMEARMVEYEDREQSLMMELEELSSARNMSEEDLIELQNEVVELRRERDSLNLEVSTMDAQSAISERLLVIQTMCLETDSRISSMESEIEVLTRGKGTLECEVRSIEAMAGKLSDELAEREQSLEHARKELERVQMELDDASEERSAPGEELAAAKLQLEAAEESMDSMSKTIGELEKSRAVKMVEYNELEERLESARVKRMESQEKLDALTVVMHEFSKSEECWRNERTRIASQMEAMKAELADKGAEVDALQNERRELEMRLLVVASEKDAALASISTLGNSSEKYEAIGQCASKDSYLGNDEVELAKARAALAGAEEKVKLLVDANATMIVEWEGERSRLNADKELLQLEISRLEKPGFGMSEQERCSSEDGESGKGHVVEELRQAVKRTNVECEKLRCKLRERDNTILSVKLQLEEAMVHYKETNIEMEKTIREKEDAISRIGELEVEVANAQEEIMRRRAQVETFEVELENVVVRVTDSEAEWRSERQQLESERDEARAYATEVECELREELDRERDGARAEAALRKRVEESGMPCGVERGDEGVSCREKSLSLESIAAFALAKEEVDLTKEHCEKEMETLAVDMKSLRADISGSFFEFPVVEIREDVKSIIDAHRAEIGSLSRKVEELESAVAESARKIWTLEAALENAEEEVKKCEECVSSAKCERAADIASACADLENTRMELEMSETAVSELLAAVSERDDSLSVSESALKETQARLAELEAELKAKREEAAAAKQAVIDVELLRNQVVGLQRQVGQKEELIKGLEYDINLLEETGSVEAENTAKMISKLEQELSEKNEEVKRLRERTVGLELETIEKMGESAGSSGAEENAKLRSKVAGLEAQLASLEALTKEEECVVVALKSELEAARSAMAESEAVSAKARESAEVFKNYANRRAEEMMANEERLKLRVAALEDEVTGLNLKLDAQRELREQVEKELRLSRQHGSSVLALESREAQSSKLSSERKLRVVEAELMMAHQRRENLQSQCDEKDRQIKVLNAQINQLTVAAGRPTSDSHQKVRGLEALMENNSGKALGRTSSMGPCMDFRNADAAARRRIEELEALAAGRLKEVYGLNAKIAELESDMHDVIRELSRTNLDVQNFRLNHPQVKEMVTTVRRQSIENQRTDVSHDAEVERLRKKLNEFIEERDSWLEEITRQQAEIVAARASAEKMRFRDDALTAENEKLKTLSAGLQKRMAELEQEIKKLSGQQNLQQRIHHHAKIKDENNSLRLQVEDLSTRLRRAEMMLGRVKDELERYRIAAGKTPFPNIDEEQRLRSKLQEAEDSKIQLAQQFITLSNAIQQAAGNANSLRQVDQLAAMEAVRKLESRLRSAEDEVSEFRLKTRISGEKRRLSELRTLQTPLKSNPPAGSLQFISSPALYR